MVHFGCDSTAAIINTRHSGTFYNLVEIAKCTALIVDAWNVFGIVAKFKDFYLLFS